MIDIIKKYLLEALLAALLAQWAAIFAKLRVRKKENECLKSAMRALLRDRIIGIYNRYCEKEYFPIYERENLAHLTQEYYALGGNGVIHELEARLISLPTERHDK